MPNSLTTRFAIASSSASISGPPAPATPAPVCRTGGARHPREQARDRRVAGTALEREHVQAGLAGSGEGATRPLGLVCGVSQAFGVHAINTPAVPRAAQSGSP